METSLNNKKKEALIGNVLLLQNLSLTFNFKNKQIVSFSYHCFSVLSPQAKPMADNVTASMEKLSCTDYVDLVKSEARFGQFSVSKDDSEKLDVLLKLLKINGNLDFRLIQDITMRWSEFK